MKAFDKFAKEIEEKIIKGLSIKTFRAVEVINAEEILYPTNPVAYKDGVIDHLKQKLAHEIVLNAKITTERMDFTNQFKFTAQIRVIEGINKDFGKDIIRDVINKWEKIKLMEL